MRLMSRFAALGDEDEGRIRELPAQLTQRSHLVAAERMRGGFTALGAADMQRRRSAELGLTPFEIGNLGGAQTVAISDENEHATSVDWKDFGARQQSFFTDRSTIGVRNGARSWHLLPPTARGHVGG
jgi:hypothetical protein